MEMAEAPEELSAREIEILSLVATGATNLQVAQALGISVNTVKAHLRRIFGKLGVESRTEATTYAIQLGLIQVGAPEEDPSAAPGGAPPATAAVPGRRLRAHLRPAQLGLLVLGLAMVLSVTIWPGPQASLAGQASRFVDLGGRGEGRSAEAAALRWTQRAPIPTERSRFAQARVGDVLYVIGGMSAEGWTTAVEGYDVAQDRWASRAPKPTAAANIGAAAVDGRIYVPGGYDAEGRALRALEVYDPATDEWSTAALMPAPRFAYGIAAYGRGFYLFGGHDGEAYVADVWHYDAEGDAWSRVGELDAPRAFLAAATSGDRIYLTGGYDGETERATALSFSPERAAAGEDPWAVHAGMGAGRAGHAMVAAEGRVYVVGGGWDGTHYYNEVYDISHDVWSTFPTPVVGQWRTLGLSSVSGQDGTRLYAIGGWNGRQLGVVEVYQATYRVYAPLQ